MARGKKKKKDFFHSYDYSSLAAATPICKHFGTCGGCRFQNITYAAQLQVKEEYLQSIFQKAVPVVAAPSEFGYRNRMDFIYHENKLSLRKRQSFDTIIPITKCYLVPPHFQEIFSEVQKLLAEYKFRSYDIDSKEGFLRYIVFRYAPSTNQMMFMCTSKTPEGDEDALFREFLSKLERFAVSIYWYINDTLTDVSTPIFAPHLILGRENITEKLAGVNLTYGPESFFQSNTAMAEIAFAKMKEFVKGNTMDICCGVGAITLATESKANSMLGIELIAEAIEYAKENATANNSQALFFTADMKHLKEFAPMEVDTIILDPPRAGVGKKPLKRILELDPETIVYLSCNPKTQALDLALIKELGGEYEEVFHEAYDFFPQTPHVESLVVLKKLV